MVPIAVRTLEIIPGTKSKRKCTSGVRLARVRRFIYTRSTRTLVLQSRKENSDKRKTLAANLQNVSKCNQKFYVWSGCFQPKV